MCWFVEVRIVAADSESASTRIKRFPGLDGAFPNYTLTEGQTCSCSVVSDDGKQVGGLDSIIDYYLSSPEVTCVEVTWYFSRKRKSVTEVCLSGDEFRRVNEAQQLQPDVLYKVCKQQPICSGDR